MYIITQSILESWPRRRGDEKIFDERGRELKWPYRHTQRGLMPNPTFLQETKIREFSDQCPISYMVLWIFNLLRVKMHIKVPLKKKKNTQGIVDSRPWASSRRRNQKYRKGITGILDYWQRANSRRRRRRRKKVEERNHLIDALG